jgi:glycosyltransferase 2 family protein
MAATDLPQHPADRIPSASAAPSVRGTTGARNQSVWATGPRVTLGIVIGIAISAIFGYIALEKISLEQVGASLSTANYFWVLPSVMLLLPIGILRAFRWKLLFRNPDDVPMGQSFAALNVGLMFNNVLPSRAGEVPRVLALRRTSGLSAFEIGATVVVERVIDVFVIALFGAVLLPVFPDQAWIQGLGLLCFGLIAGFVFLVVALVVLREKLSALLSRLLNALPFVSTQRAEEIRLAVGAGGSILVDPWRLVEVVGVSILVWGLGGLSAWVLFPAFDLQVGASAPWLILVANTLAIAIPSGPATIGLYEASVQAALIASGVGASTALSYAVVLHAVNFFPVILMGLISSWWIGLHPARQMQPESALG